MARITVEDCLKNVKNRFELVLLASKRARQLMRGNPALVEWENDKATVVALREIAAGHTQFKDVPRHEDQNEHIAFHENPDFIPAVTPLDSFTQLNDEHE